MLSSLKIWKQNYDTQDLFKRQVRTFFILFIGYASLHTMRTGWSFAQKYIQDDIPEVTDRDIGLMDTAFLLFLGIGLCFCGHISDSFNPKKFLLFGMFLASLSVMGIGISRVFFITDVYIYILLQACNGLFESAALPGFIKMLGNWFSSDNRGLLMGIWSGCRSFGDMIGLIIGDLTILRFDFSWYWSLAVFGGICMFCAYIIYEFVNEKPSEGALATIEEDECEECSIVNPSYFRKAQFSSSLPQKSNDFELTNMDSDDLEKLREKLILKYGGSSIMNSKKAVQEYQSISVIEAFKIPGVLWYTLDFMCLKSLNYGILFWFPKFLQQNNLESNSSGISTMWSFGVLLGGIFQGYVGDRLHKRRGILMPPSLLLLILSLAYFDKLRSTVDSLAMFYLVSFLIGVFLGGPYNVQHGPLLIDLGKHSVLSNNQQAVGTVTGIIEGAGSFASALIQMLIPVFGQEKIFQMFIYIAILGIFFILPVAIEDYHFLKEKPTWFNKSESSTKPSLTLFRGSQEMRDFNSKLIGD